MNIYNIEGFCFESSSYKRELKHIEEFDDECWHITTYKEEYSYLFGVCEECEHELYENCENRKKSFKRLQKMKKKKEECI